MYVYTWKKSLNTISNEFFDIKFSVTKFIQDADAKSNVIFTMTD